MPELNHTRDRMRAQLKDAMRARDGIQVAALRSALAALDNAESFPTEARAGAVEQAVGLGAAEVPRRVLSEADVEAVLQGEIDELLTAADQLVAAGRDDSELRARAEVIRRHI